MHASIKTITFHNQLRIGHPATRVGNRERTEGRVHKPGVGGALANENAIRQNVAAFSEKRLRPGTDSRVDDRGALFVAGAHDILTLLVRPVGGHHRIDHRKLVSLFGEFLQVHPEFYRIHIGIDDLGTTHDRLVLFGIEGVKMGHPAGQVDVNQVFGLCSVLRLKGAGEERNANTEPEAQFS